MICPHACGRSLAEPSVGDHRRTPPVSHFDDQTFVDKRPTGYLDFRASVQVRDGVVAASLETYKREIVWLEDPSLCRTCGKPMPIVSAITSPGQDDVIERVLRHLQIFDPPWQRERAPRARAPPPSFEFDDAPPPSEPAFIDPPVDDEQYIIDPPDDDWTG